MRKSLGVFICLLVIMFGIVGSSLYAGWPIVSKANSFASCETCTSDNHSFDVSNMDTSVSACVNFFQYADGGWVAKNEIPTAYPSWGRFN